MIIDFHTHAFPDEIAHRAMPRLEEEANCTASLDGTIGQLCGSLERAGIDLSVLLQVATRPGQEKTVNSWAASIQSENLIAFGGMHPDSPNWRGELARLLDLGLPGVKLHPDYQDFYVDEPRLFPFYEALCRANLIVVFHAGIDIGLPDPCHAPPARIRHVVQRFPEGRWVAAHMGGYLCWDEVEEYLSGLPLYLDTSYCLPDLEPDRMIGLIRTHGAGRILFGTDSPWRDQKDAIEQIKGLALSEEEKEAIFHGNARKLLGL